VVYTVGPVWRARANLDQPNEAGAGLAGWGHSSETSVVDQD
jgi:hypothetical protein